MPRGRLRTSRDPEHVRLDRAQQRARPEREAAQPLDLEARGGDRGGRVAIDVAAAGKQGQPGDEAALQAAQLRVLGATTCS